MTGPKPIPKLAVNTLISTLKGGGNLTRCNPDRGPLVLGLRCTYCGCCSRVFGLWHCDDLPAVRGPSRTASLGNTDVDGHGFDRTDPLNQASVQRCSASRSDVVVGWLTLLVACWVGTVIHNITRYISLPCVFDLYRFTGLSGFWPALQRQDVSSPLLLLSEALLDSPVAWAACRDRQSSYSTWPAHYLYVSCAQT